MKAARVIGWILLAAGLAETLTMNLFTLAEVGRARTSVPYADEWVLSQDVAHIERGDPIWPVLWAPYWGERQVVTRLLWLANAHYRALASLTWLTLLLQFVHIGLFLGVAWLFVRSKANPAPFLVACVAILNLLLSPFQMWNFTWSTQIMFILVCLAATSAFLCLALGFTAAALLLAVLATLTMPNGLFVWPVLAIQAVCLKRSCWSIALPAVPGVIAFAAYLWHYQTFPMGMGTRGMLHHPLQGILLTAVVSAGPIAFLSNPVGAAVGVLALALAAYLSFRALRPGAPGQRWASVLVANVMFVVLSAASIVAGRLDKRFLGDDSLYSVPVRYPTMVLVMWVSIALLAIHTCWRMQLRPVLLGLCSLPLLYMMFGTIHLQRVMAEDWSDFFRGADAAGAAFILNAPDDPVLWRLWQNPSQRAEWLPWFRDHRLAMFHEPRATWIGKNAADLFTPAAFGQCAGAIEQTTPLANDTVRVQGWAWDTARGASPDYMLLTDASGRIVGQARGGLRHGYIPGLLIEPGTVPASHAHFAHSDWLGYATAENAPLTLVAIFGKQREVCVSR